MEGCMMALVLAVLVLYVLFTYWQYIAIFAVIFIAIIIIGLVVHASNVSEQLKNIQYAVILGKTRVMTTKSRPSGYSISSRGNFRAYWRFRNEVDHIEVEFEVHYESGEVRRITANEDSSLYNGLMPYVGLKPKPPVPKPTPAPPIVEPPKPVEISPPKEPIKHMDEVKTLPEAKPAEQPKPKRKEEKRFAEVPFEVAPNEYSLVISYPSCQMIRWASGEYRIEVRFAVSYDPTVKGVRNRVVTCATVDSSGRMTAVRRDNKVLDLSGSRMVDIMFWENAEQEPAKIVVGIDRYY